MPTLARAMRAAAALDLRAALRDLQIPTLVLCGANDRFNVPLSKALAEQLPDARFEVIPNAGHVANLDNPAAFNAALERFLDAPSGL
jgi:pimeloyl-ACP methyl ester carboxylesterase